MPAISIIIPVYNSRDYIVTCFESIKNQTLDDIEVLFVDDHGNDGSISVINKYIDGYSGKKTFRIIQTVTNSGPGVARNVGLARATGEYVAFVDADDWIENNFCESLLKSARSKKADMAYCDIRIDNISNGKSSNDRNPRVSSGEFTEKKHRYFLTRYVSYFTTFLYKREFLNVNGLRFPQTRSSEDSCFLASCLLCAQRVSNCRKALYHYVRRSHSLSTKTDPTRYLQKLSSFDELIQFAKAHDLYSVYKDELDFIYIKKAFVVAAFSYIGNADKPSADVIREMVNGLKNRIPEYSANPYLKRSIKARVFVWMLANYPLLTIAGIRRKAKRDIR